MCSKNFKSLIMACLMLGPSLGSLTFSSLAFAELEEIVVTARARTESLQDVPATITAFTESQIENMGVQRAEDFIGMTPGVTLVNTVEVGDTQLSIRGINGARDAAKGAILSFTRSLALEIGSRNVTANCVAPGATLTPILDDVPEDMLNEIKLAIPRQKIAEVSEIIDTYIFLASEGAVHFRGQCLSPNGGDVFL